jgi:ketosteroid isomerase-like protein/mono/diheme cytochrome c family protein
MKTLRTVVITFAVLAVIAAAVVYSGTFNIAADDPHWGITSRTIESMRDRSIARQAYDVTVPSSLDDAKLIASGASEYAEMCTGCHLAPGMKDTEMRKGLYPMPPELAKHGSQRSPAEQFWIIKHGIKMTGMPAWGVTHDDQRIWSMVAFLQKLPSLSAAQYRELAVSREGGHSHDEMASQDESHSDDAKDHHHGDHNSNAEADANTRKPAEQAHDHQTHDHASNSTSELPASVADAAAVVDRFQKLLAEGNTTAAAELLDPTVLIFESGGAERSRAEYASHHLKSDAEFMRTATLKQLSRRGNVSGDLAFVATESSLKVSGAKAADLTSTETMVLRRTPQGWRVTHIHWSSRANK